MDVNSCPRCRCYIFDCACSPLSTSDKTQSLQNSNKSTSSLVTDANMDSRNVRKSYSSDYASLIQFLKNEVDNESVTSTLQTNTSPSISEISDENFIHMPVSTPQHRLQHQQNISSSSINNNIENLCKWYLDSRNYSKCLHLDSGLCDILDLYRIKERTIQDIIAEQNIDSIRILESPQVLPIKISELFKRENSYIIPNDVIDIRSLLTNYEGAHWFKLEAILCTHNKNDILYYKYSKTKQWYYYQSKTKDLVKLDDKLNKQIIRLCTNTCAKDVESVGFLIDILLTDAVKYFYVQSK
ncbi:unnamed protein product [Didymodactylos carnosus]|uniref:Uncharacterized protein n=1 Tax=Didymodactylos carnosus TaxID=1234261 RepID=A0A8S2ES17_9BILA|nr:unnamed protein product [Didymodactylos carnosus]CAF4030099.1 unnamed protein product [Didymodactylos carnosus]